MRVYSVEALLQYIRLGYDLTPTWLESEFYVNAYMYIQS